MNREGSRAIVESPMAPRRAASPPRASSPNPAARMKYASMKAVAVRRCEVGLRLDCPIATKSKAIRAAKAYTHWDRLASSLPGRIRPGKRGTGKTARIERRHIHRRALCQYKRGDCFGDCRRKKYPVSELTARDKKTIENRMAQHRQSVG